MVVGIKLALFLSANILVISAFSVDTKSQGSGCLDLLCPATALDYGVKTLVNDDTLKGEVCNSCSQCTLNGYSVCLRVRDSRASRQTSPGCSCAHQLAANCNTDVSQTSHPSNITMRLYSACYTDSVQKPPMPLANNENSSVIVTIEPFWTEPYWKHMEVDNLTLHYKFLVKVPEHCDGEVTSTDEGVHTCSASKHIDIKGEDVVDEKERTDSYEHSDNYDQYDDQLPPEVEFDRDVFAGAKELVAYFTVTVRRPRQISVSSPMAQQIVDKEGTVESEHLKFDLKPEVFGIDEVVKGHVESREDKKEEESAETETRDDDDADVSEEKGGTNFFEDDSVKKDNEDEEEDDKEESKEDEGVAHVSLEDVKPTKLSSENKDEDEKEESMLDLKPAENDEKDDKKEDEEKEDDKKEDAEEKDEKSSEEEEKEGNSEEKKEEVETTTEAEEESKEVEQVEASGNDQDESEQSLWSRITNNDDFHRVRLVFLATLALFIGFIALVLCYRKRAICCGEKESKSSNGYRYSSANQPSELVSREKEHLRQ